MESSVGNQECKWMCQMELKYLGFFCRLATEYVASKGRFLKLVCATFTTFPLSIGYFTQNVCSPGKI